MFDKLRTHIALQHFSLRITHEPCSFFGTPAKDLLLLTSSDENRNILSRIEISGKEFNRSIYLHWFYREYVDDFGILLVEETGLLFLGAGTYSGVIDLNRLLIIQEKVVDSFWHYERVSDWILELGELDCFLYNKAGSQVDCAPVDPPYEYTVTPDGIRFECIVYGTQWLRFPKT